MTHIQSKTLCLIKQWIEHTNGTARPRQRLQPGGKIIVVMTRWVTDDLTGRLVKAQSEPKADKWNVIEFPAIMPNGQPVWPEYWKLEDLEAVKASVSTKIGMPNICRTQLQRKVRSSKENGGKT